MFNQVIASILLFTAVSSATAQQPFKGMPAHNISLPGVNGDTIQLSSLKGKVVLVDFWASWCGPCRVINRNMINLYSKYKEEGFEVFGISFDTDITRWVSAIAIDKISWLQVNQPGLSYSPVAKAWGVDKLPCSFLLNKEGVIIAIDPSYGVLKSWLDELLFKAQSK